MVIEYFCIIFLYVKGVHGRLFLGAPCNEVHGIILGMDTSQCSDVYIFIYLCVCDVSVTFLFAQCKSCLHLSGCM